MKDAVLREAQELIRETFEGGLPGQGTQYLDHDSGIRSTLGTLAPDQASFSRTGHPTIAAHARHMNFHLRAVSEWMEGDRRKRDWKGSFKPERVNADEWSQLQEDLERSRSELIRVLASLDAERFEKEGIGAAMGAVAHLAYHLGAIRQLLHDA